MASAFILSEMVAKAERLEKDGAALRSSIAKAEERLAQMITRLEALVNLVDKQAQHLRQLRVRSEEGQVVYLPDYREMKIRHHQYRVDILESRATVSIIKTELKNKKTAVAQIERELKDVRAVLDSRGKLIPLRK